jgi:hypothetical protein
MEWVQIIQRGVIDVKAPWSTKNSTGPTNIFGGGDASGAVTLSIQSFWRTGVRWLRDNYDHEAGPIPLRTVYQFIKRGKNNEEGGSRLNNAGSIRDWD